jgi:hypothetical protein
MPESHPYLGSRWDHRRNQPDECPRDDTCTCDRGTEQQGPGERAVKFTASGLAKVARNHGTWQGCYGTWIPASEFVWSYGWGFAAEPNYGELVPGVDFVEVRP